MTSEQHVVKRKSPRPIQKLPELLINQIAAGEVVERPASILKELVENSLDAEASRIAIFVKSGGMEEIKVSDNGWGMEVSDLPLAFERHATSKISSQADLEGINTFGFRGEALSSIASVSEVTLTTRRFNVDYAVEVSLSNGEIVTPLKKNSGSVGTSITIRSLFAKVPARQKFLRTPATELSHCLRSLKEIALGNPQCVFSLAHHERTLVHYNQSTLVERFKEVLRPLWEPDYFSEGTQGMQYEMLLSPYSPQMQKGELFLFINQRSIRNRTLLQAVKQAYTETFGPMCEPSGCVYLTLRTDWVDPNVHPQKQEVRFLKQEILFQWLLSSLRKKLAPFKPKVDESLTQTENSNILSMQPFATLSEQIQFKANLKEGFLLFEDETGFLATHENILRELILRKTLLEEGPSSQALSVPLLINLTGSSKETLQRKQQLFDSFGFEMEIFGEQELAIKSVPSFFPESNIEVFFRAVLSSSMTAEQEFKRLAKYSSHLETQNPLPGLSAQSQTPDGKAVFFRVLFDDLKRYFSHYE